MSTGGSREMTKVNLTLTFTEREYDKLIRTMVARGKRVPQAYVMGLVQDDMNRARQVEIERVVGFEPEDPLYLRTPAVGGANDL